MSLADEVSVSDLVPGWLPVVASIYVIIGVPLAVIVYRDAKRHRVRPGNWVASMFALWPVMVWIHFFHLRRKPDYWRSVDMSSSDGSGSSPE